MITTFKMFKIVACLKLLNAYGELPDLLFLYPAPFKLFRWYSFVMYHLLTCLTTFNIGEYINEIELNNLNVVFRQYATRCILSST